MGEYAYDITANTDRRPENIEEVKKFKEWYDNTEPEMRLEEAVKLGFIEFRPNDDGYFLETVLDECRRLNHGSEWIKEIMDREREFDNPYLDISEEAEERGAYLDEVIEEYKMHIGIRDWCISANAKPPVRTREEAIRSMEETLASL